MRWTAPTTGIEVPDFRLMLRGGLSPLMAKSRPPAARIRLPLSPQHRTFRGPRWTSGFDPTRTSMMADTDQKNPTPEAGKIASNDPKYLPMRCAGDNVRFEFFAPRLVRLDRTQFLE